MGRRARRRGADAVKAPNVDYVDGEANTLTLRGSLPPAARASYAAARGGNPLSQEDARERGFELLFELLAVSWTIAGVPISRQGELLGRLRLASPSEREWVRARLREHCAEHFPDVVVD
jgi:hypothetical protein